MEYYPYNLDSLIKNNTIEFNNQFITNLAIVTI